MIGIFVLAWGTRSVLSTAEGRIDAVWVAPLAIGWGMTAAAAAHRSRKRSVSFAMVITVGILLRCTQLGAPWLLSDDAWRYLWEGTLLNDGGNPFTQAPNTVLGLNDDLRERVNHPGITSIYPPLALWWFRALAVFGTALATQAMTAALDVLTLVAVWQIGHLRRFGHWPAVFYALHPLPVLELAGAAHVEGPAVCAAAVGLWAWETRRPMWAWTGLAAGGAIKLLPFVALAAFIPRQSRSRTATAGVATVLGFLALASPVLDGGTELLTGLGTYSRHWSFNGLLYPWLTWGMGGLARPVLGLVGLAILATAIVRRLPPAELLLCTGLAFLAVTPTAHPWYALWVLMPALAVGRFWLGAATIPVLASYGVLLGYDPVTAAWSEPAWLWWVTWPPAIGLALVPTLLSRLNTPTAP